MQTGAEFPWAGEAEVAWVLWQVLSHTPMDEVPAPFVHEVHFSSFFTITSCTS